jgi:hypothetical protein
MAQGDDIVKVYHGARGWCGEGVLYDARGWYYARIRYRF